MQFYTLPNGEDLNISTIISVTPVSICKHDSSYNNYDIQTSDGKSHCIFENEKPRAELLAELGAL